MKQYNNILVVAEPKKDVQLALKRALEITRFNPRATITYFRVAYDYSYDLIILNKVKEKLVVSDVEKTYLEHMEKVISEYRTEENLDTPIIPKVVESKDVGEAVIEEVNSGNYDLIIKAANHHSVLDSIIFTPIDWYILRNSKVPVIIAKENAYAEGSNIVVCVDFATKNHSQSNLAMLREAQILAKLIHGTIHLVNSAPVYLPSIMIEIPHYSPALYEQNIVDEHKNRLKDFALKHHIPLEQCHTKEGMPDDVIPKVCSQLKPCAVFIGSAGRSGIMATLIGNTCEEIVDEIDADLFVLSSKAIN